MKVVLNTNGILAKYYRWYYDTKTLPENLCPYFWRLLGALIMMPFAFLETIFIMILNALPGGKVDRLKNRIFGPIIGTMAMISIFIIAAVVLSMIIFPFGIMLGYRMTGIEEEITSMFDIIAGIAIGGYAISIIMLLTFIIIEAGKYQKRARERRRLKKSNAPSEPKKKYSSVFGSMIKASYKKVCPKIDWE